MAPASLASRVTDRLLPLDATAARTYSVEAAMAALSRCGEGVLPRRANPAQERWVDDELAEWVDESHVYRRPSGDVPHVNADVEAVGSSRFDEGAQRCGMDDTVDQLEKLFVLEAVHDSEGPFARARWHKGLREISGCQPGRESLSDGCVRLVIPTEEAADGETDVQERAHDRGGSQRPRARGPEELIQRDAGAHSRQLDGPHVMKRNAGKKVMNPQWQPLKLLRRDLWHRASTRGWPGRQLVLKDSVDVQP